MNNISDKNEALEERIKEFCEEMFPYVDTIQIFISNYESKEKITLSYNYGLGNYNAIYGQIEQWLNREIENVEEDD